LKSMFAVFCAVFLSSCAISSECSLYQSRDLQLSCMAGYNHNVSYCYKIEKKDTKNFCFAKITKIRDYCDEIVDKDEQIFCYVIIQ